MFRTITSPLSTRLVALLAITLFSLTMAACASSKDSAAGSDERIERQLASLKTAVTLTDAQTTRVRAIMISGEANRPSGAPPPPGGQGGADPRAEREAQRAEMDRQIESVLTEAQVVQYREWKSNQPQPSRQRQGPPPGGR